MLQKVACQTHLSRHIPWYQSDGQTGPEPHGGRMRVDRESIVLLNPPYVFAFADDGHVGGWMLLEYVPNEDGRLHWKRIWWRKE